jgi:hypothetical protein
MQLDRVEREIPSPQDPDRRTPVADSEPSVIGDKRGVTLRTTTEFATRTLSVGEYYHASLGTSGKTLEVPRENVIVLEGLGSFDVERLRSALAAAAHANPATRLRLVGNSFRARWEGDGKGPQLRVVNNCSWDGMSQNGAEFIYATPLRATEGVTSEFILANRPGQGPLLIFRNLHSIMDGMGCMHFLQELFRSLRGEPLEGTNAVFRDTDLMQSVPSDQSTQIPWKEFKIRPAYATGGPRGTEFGDSWQKIYVKGPVFWLLARVSTAVTEFAHRYSDTKVRIAVPVNMRRHLPQIRTTLNMTGVQYVELQKGDNVAKFQQSLHKAMKVNNETNYHWSAQIMRLFPLGMVERHACRTKKNYLTNRIIETAMISDLGAFKSRELSGGGFTATHLYGVPLPGNTFGLLAALDDEVAISIGMPNVYANEGRLSDLIGYISNKLSSD